MSKTFSILAAASLVASFAATSHAQQLLSLQYQTNGSPYVRNGTPPTAGVFPAGNFNVAALPYVGSAGSNALNGLVDSTGATTTINETTMSIGGYDQNPKQGFTPGTGNYNLFVGFALGNYGGFSNITMTLSNLDPATTYSLLTYVTNSDTSGTVMSGYTDVAGLPTYYLKAENAAGTFDRGLATTSANATPGNYFQFDGITGVSSLTFTLPGVGGNVGFNGFQLMSTVPEPSTYAAVLIGSGILFVAHRSRRRGAVSAI